MLTDTILIHSGYIGSITCLTQSLALTKSVQGLNTQ